MQTQEDSIEEAVENRLMNGLAGKPLVELINIGQWDFLWAFWEMGAISFWLTFDSAPGDRQFSDNVNVDTETRQEIIRKEYFLSTLTGGVSIIGSFEKKIPGISNWVEQKRKIIELMYKTRQKSSLLGICKINWNSKDENSVEEDWFLFSAKCIALFISFLLEPPSFFEKETWLIDSQQNSSDSSYQDASQNSEADQVISSSDREILPIGVTLDHRQQEIIVNGKRSSAGQYYLLFYAIWSAESISHEDVAEAVYGHHKDEWPQDWNKNLQELKSNVQSFLNTAKSGLGDYLLPSRKKVKNSPHVMPKDLNGFQDELGKLLETEVGKLAK